MEINALAIVSAQVAVWKTQVEKLSAMVLINVPTVWWRSYTADMEL
jgi:hypothetical protein